jgi:hypothetical protein
MTCDEAVDVFVRWADCTGIARGPTGHDTTKAQDRRITPLSWAFFMERMTGIEPACSAWEADVLPLNYIRALPDEGIMLTLRDGAPLHPARLPDA